MVNVSIIIASFNRQEILINTLEQLSKSKYPIHEIIIVDASEVCIRSSQIPSDIRALTQIISSVASVCIQRNIGMAKASGDYIFICDDDIEVPDGYIQHVIEYLIRAPEVSIASGLVMERNANGDWSHSFPVGRRLGRWGRHLFLLSLWTERPVNPLSDPNRIRVSGWPMIRDLSQDVNPTPIYGLGASISRADWLKQANYDPVLDPAGIGDNYGLMITHPRSTDIHVLSTCYVKHHKSEVARQPSILSFYRRCLALDYFQKRAHGRRLLFRIAFSWSMVGNVGLALLHMDFRKAWASLKVIMLCLINRNPYWLGYKKGEQRIRPEL